MEGLRTRRVAINESGSNHAFPGNRVTNTKYTLLTFVPLNLYEQFSQHMNRYFLLIACLQLVQEITPVHPASTWVPLLTVVSLSAAKEAYDDIRRKRRDDIANRKPVVLVRDGQRRETRAEDIRVGDIVMVRQDEEVPADLCVIASSHPSGVCYIQSSNLDGEAAYKERCCPLACDPATVPAIRGTIVCNQPSSAVYRFEGRLEGIGATTSSLGEEHFLPQSTVLRHTDYLWGVAVYTGPETKLGLNKLKPHMKWSEADRSINSLSLFVFLWQLGLVCVFGLVGNSYSRDIDEMFYLGPPDNEHWEHWFSPAIVPARFLLLCSMMIPISLKVTLDFIRAAYAAFIEWDMRMYDPTRDQYCSSNNTAISEELGLITTVLTDKTGTLTENVMRFTKCMILQGPNDASASEQSRGRSLRFYGEDSLERDLSLAQAFSGRNPHVLLFLRALSLCHTVVPEIQGDGRFCYRSPSPDEEALVRTNAALGVEFKHRTKTTMTLCVDGVDEVYETVQILPFSPERRRMSVLVREPRHQRLLLFIKGADDAVIPLLRRTPQPHSSRVLREFDAGLEMFAAQGLRMLCVAWRPVSPEEYAAYHEAHRNAANSLVNRQSELAKVYDLLEKEFELLGAAAIKDKLQEGVAETISTLRQAGVRFWMLTGDKQSTALQIATACNLHTVGTSVVDFGSDAHLETLPALIQAQHELINASPSDTGARHTVLVSSRALDVILADATNASMFLDICRAASAIVFARMTPLQKVAVVRLANRAGERTLAIGDGGNDVGMIQEAHVGVGIEGKEGRQAARAADFSFTRFKHLKALMFVHGSLSVTRTAFVYNYSFYKSMVICFTQLLFATASQFSGASLFDSISLMSYNVFYTGLPVLLYVLDRHAPLEVLEDSPLLYREMAKGRLLAFRVFVWWAIRAVCQACVIAVCVVGAMGGYLTTQGRSLGQVELGLVVFTALVLLQLLTIALESRSLTWVNVSMLAFTTIALFAVNTAISAIPRFAAYGSLTILAQQPVYWLSIVLAIVCALIPVIVSKAFHGVERPSPSVPEPRQKLVGRSEVELTAR